MSYLRSPVYVWQDGYHTHIWDWHQEPYYAAYIKDCDVTAGIALPNDMFDALCLMRVAQIDASRNRRKYELKALEKYGGNFGSYALYKRVGQIPPWQKEKPVVDE